MFKKGIKKNQQVLQNDSSNQIHGPGLQVEIDESKFGKTKYNRGRNIKGQWDFGGICHETRELFVTAVPICDHKKH